MTNSIAEKDWKYLRSVEKELLSELCRTINQKAAAIVHAESGSEYDKYLLLFKYIKGADAIVAECFDDWRRSNLLLKLPLLHRHKLLRDEHILNLTAETCERLSIFIGTENVWSPEKRIVRRFASRQKNTDNAAGTECRTHSTIWRGPLPLAD